MLDKLRTYLSYMVAPAYLKQGTLDDFTSAILSGSRMGSTHGPPRSTRDLLEAYGRMPWLRAVVHKVSHSTAMVPWRLFIFRNVNDRAVRVAKAQRGDQATRWRAMRSIAKQMELVEIEDHPALDLLNEGTEIFPGVGNFQLTQAYFDLTGEAFQLKQRNRIQGQLVGRGLPKSLLPIPPHWVRSLPSRDEPFFGVQLGSTGAIDEVPKEDMIYFRDPNPHDPFGRGTGTAKSLGDELQANEAASMTIRARLENNAIPPYVVMPEKEKATAPGEEVIERIREKWERRMRGPSRTGMLHFLRNRFEFFKMGNTFEELSLIPLLENQRNTIIQVYGLPPEILGVIENSNRATIEAAEVLFAKHVLMPRLEFNRAVLQKMLIEEFDDRLILDFESPVPEDKEFQLEVMKEHSWAFQADEIRERAGADPLPDDGGRVHAVPANLFLQPDLLSAAEEEPEEPEESEEEQIAYEPGTAVIPPGFKTDPAVFNKQTEEELKRILDAVDKETLDETTGVEFREGIRSAGQRRLDDLGIEVAFDMNNPKVIEFVANQSAKQIVGINNTTKKLLRKTLAEGFEEGEGINSLARRIREAYSGIRGRRSVAIARTESVRALNAGQVIATKQAGFEGKQWLSTRDGRVRDTHAIGTGLDGQIRRVDDNFESPSGATGPWPGALSTAAEVVNCRCTTLSVSRVSADDIRSKAWPPNLDSESKREQVWRAAERIRLPIERRLLRAFRRGFALQERKTLDALRRVLGED